MDENIKYIYKMFLGSIKTGKLVSYGNKLYYEWKNQAGLGFIKNRSKMVEKFASSSVAKFIKI